MPEEEKEFSIRILDSSGVFSLSCITDKSVTIDFADLESLVRKTIKDFRRPTFWRDTYADATGVLTNGDLCSRPDADISESANIAIHSSLENQKSDYKVIGESGETVFLDGYFKSVSPGKQKVI